MISIVGCGISGLYVGIRLLDTGLVSHVTIFEKSTRPGGRVFTDRISRDVCIEGGAGRFNKGHTRLWQLLSRYDLLSDIFPLAPKKQYIKNGKPTRFDCDAHLHHVVQEATRYDRAFLETIPFKVLLSLVITTPEVVDDIIYSFGYNTEMEYMNAWETLQLLKNDFDESIEYFGLKGGLSRLINCMVQEFTQKGGIIRYNTCVDTYDSRTTTLYDTKGDILSKAPYVIFCLPRSALCSISGVVEQNDKLKECMSHLSSQPLLRMYAQFPSCWFKNVKRTTTNSIIRYIIPIDMKHNIMMISYTDGMYADMLAHIPEKQRTHVVMSELKKVYPSINIPDPIWVKSYYWDDGGHYWKPGCFRIYKNTPHSISKHKYIVCGELLSEHNHAWIEGALQSAHDACISLKRVLWSQ